MISKLENIRYGYGVPTSVLLDQAGFSRSSYVRWKRRNARGEPPVKKPGPRKIAPLPLDQLKADIESLKHGNRRTGRTGKLYEKYRPGISRRELNSMVREARDEHRHARSSSRCRVVWHCPDLAWSLDGSEYRHVARLGKIHIQNIQDLCSQYKFVPLTSRHTPCGEELAGHLSYHFSKFGPPLFLKRDNAGNLNHPAVDSVLSEAMVIPLNSPIYTASYNGAIEHSQGEFKAYLKLWQQKAETISELSQLVETASHNLNHQIRRALKGKNACSTYFGKNRLKYNKRKRKEAYDWISDLALEISSRSDKTKIDPAAWRIACRKWMEKNDLITIIKPRKVLPHFPPILGHN